MKIGLVMEGGAMRGMFTAGVMDVFMENNIEFAGAIGTSAGAVFGCNYKSRQIGRVIRYNKRFCRNRRYASVRNLILTGNLYGEDFAYHKLPNELDVFDTKVFSESEMEFYVCTTDVVTGGARYHKCTDGKERDTEWMRASASMPLVSRIVEVDGYKMLDGGMADSIPIKKMEDLGYEKNVVILTQPYDYVKAPNGALPLMRMRYRKYPRFVESVKNRHINYNETTRYIKEGEKEGRMLVIRPEESLKIGKIERDEDALERVYQIGRKTGEKYLSRVREFIAD